MKFRYLPAATLILPFVLLINGCTDAIVANRGDLCTYVPANRQLEPGARVKGKVSVVFVSNTFNAQTNNGCRIDGYSGPYSIDTSYFPSSMHASTPDEIDTLILIVLKKGDFLRTVDLRMTKSLGWLTDVYAGQMEVSLIDYKSATLVGNSVSTVSKIPERVDRDDLIFAAGGDTRKAEYVVVPTVAEIREALRQFSSDVKND